MRQVSWTDEDGFLHQALLPDHALEAEAARGIPLDPPPFLTLLDWDGMGRELWNLLVTYGIHDWDSHQASPQLLAQAVRLSIQIPLINLYKAETRDRGPAKE